MLRQFDPVRGSDIIVDGETLEIIEPFTFQEFVKALNILNRLEKEVDNNPLRPDRNVLDEALRLQSDYIAGYVAMLGDYKNSTLANNISFLTSKYGLKIGELESLLGISTGYISRTTKEGTVKKMSIDVVWKIARIFNISLQDLIGNDLEGLKGNNALLQSFLNKLIKRTENGEHDWQNYGGVACYLDSRLEQTKLFEELDEGCRYYPDHLNREMKWVLTGDVMACEKFSGNDDCLAIIPFAREGEDRFRYDLMLIHGLNKGTKVSWEKVLYTSDDPFGKLDDKAAELYEVIVEMETDAKLSSNMRNMVQSYLMDEDE